MGRIVGLDTAANRWHAVQDDGAFFCVSELKNKKWSNPDDRRAELVIHFRHYMAGLPSDSHIYCEEPLALAKNGKTTRLLGLAAGALWAVSRDYPTIQWHWVDVAHWKKIIVGNGNANKEMIIAHVADRWGVTYDEEDHADAHCLMEYGKLHQVAGPAIAGART